MKLEYLILGLLEIEPRTGYEIKKFMDSEGRFGRASAPLSQIYNTLKRMHENGWVSFEEELREGKPDLKLYTSTPLGKKELLDYLTSPVKPPFRYLESDLRNRIVFAFLVEPKVIIEQLQTELAYRKEQIATFRPRDRRIYSTKLPAGQLAYAQELHEKLHNYGARSMDDYVRWIEEMIEYFETRQRSIENGH